MTLLPETMAGKVASDALVPIMTSQKAILALPVQYKVREVIIVPGRMAAPGEGPPARPLLVHFWMQVSTVSLVHSSRPVNTGSATGLPSINSIMTVGAL